MSELLDDDAFNKMREDRNQFEAKLKTANKALHYYAEALGQLVGSQWEHRCDDGVGGCTAVSVTAIDDAAAVLAVHSLPDDFQGKGEADPDDVLDRLRLAQSAISAAILAINRVPVALMEYGAEPERLARKMLDGVIESLGRHA
jgi:hypothetical protein